MPHPPANVNTPYGQLATYKISEIGLLPTRGWRIPDGVEGLNSHAVWGRDKEVGKIELVQTPPTLQAPPIFNFFLFIYFFPPSDWVKFGKGNGVCEDTQPETHWWTVFTANELQLESKTHLQGAGHIQFQRAFCFTIMKSCSKFWIVLPKWWSINRKWEYLQNTNGPKALKDRFWFHFHFNL